MDQTIMESCELTFNKNRCSACPRFKECRGKELLKLMPFLEEAENLTEKRPFNTNGENDGNFDYIHLTDVFNIIKKMGEII